MSKLWQNFFNNISDSAATDSWGAVTGGSPSPQVQGKSTTVPGSVGTYVPTPTYDKNAGTYQKISQKGFTNNSTESFWVKPEKDYDAAGKEVKQNDPDKDRKVVYWSSGAYEVTAGSTFTLPIDGYTKHGLGYVVKVNDWNDTGVWADENGKVHIPTWNIRGGRLTSPPDPSWNQLFEHAD